MRSSAPHAPSDRWEPHFSGVVRPLTAWIGGDRSYGRVVAVERILSLDAAALRARLLEDVRGLLIHARDTVAWHRERMAQAGFDPAALTSLDGLAGLPPLTREDLSASAERLLSSAFAGRALIEARTGGTTSAAVPFVQTRDAIAWKDAAAHALKARMGWRPGHRSAFLWGAAQDGPPPATDAARRLRAEVKRRLDRTLWLPAGDLSDAHLDEYAERVRCFAPHALQGYPSAVDLLARRLLARGERLYVPIVLLTAEPVLPEQRERIAAALGAAPFTFYGARECGWIASECAARHRLHVNTAGVYLESDVDGRLLVTDLVNRAMPLIRYVIGDRGTLDPEACPCGDPRPVLKGLEGRINDVFVLPSGRRVPGVVADLRSYRIGLGILEAQLVQEELSTLDVHWVAGPQYQAGDEAQMGERLDRMFFGELTIRLHRVDRLLASPNGKVRYCVSRVAGAAP